ncbi:MAG: hypothetical protein AAFZ15_33705 [Bacteroidota bacterium]
MKNILLNSKPLFQLVILVLAFFVTQVQSTQAQAGELNITNNTDCDLYVAGISGATTCTLVSCTTAYVLVSANGGTAQIQPCGASTNIWMASIHSIGCVPGTFSCTVGRTPNTFTACSGSPWVGTCNAGSVTGTWSDATTVEFN